MKKYLLSSLAFLISLATFSQFSGNFAPANWTFSSTTMMGDGSVNTTGAPASIVLRGSDTDLGFDWGQHENWAITIPQNGTISFNFSMVQPDIDYSYYVINGIRTLIASTTTSGSKSNIAVNAGQIFAFRVVNDNDCCGRGVLTVSNFLFTPLVSNNPPTDIALSASSINENVAGNTIVGIFSTTDPNAGNTFTYALVSGIGSTDNASFNISGSSLRITNSPNYETKSSYSVRVRTIDQGGLTYEEALTIIINNLNETPTDIALSATSVAENVPANTTVGSLSSTDPDAANTFTYTLVAGTGDTDNASFNISGSSLRVTNIPDFETKSSYSVRVRTTDQGGLTYEEVFTVMIIDEDEGPTDISLTSLSISENQPIGTTIGSLSSTPSSGSYSYSIVAGAGDLDNSSFTLKTNSTEDQNSGSGNTGIGIFGFYGAIWQSFTAGSSGSLATISLRVNGGSTSYTMKLKVFSGEGIGGTMLGEATALLVVSSGYVTWNFSGISLTSGQKYTFQLTDWTFSDGNYGLYAWNNGTQYSGGQMNYPGYPGYELAFKTYIATSVDIVSAISFDYEIKSSYSVRVRSTNALTNYYEEALAITINDLDRKSVV